MFGIILLYIYIYYVPCVIFDAMW